MEQAVERASASRPIVRSDLSVIFEEVEVVHTVALDIIYDVTFALHSSEIKCKVYDRLRGKCVHQGVYTGPSSKAAKTAFANVANFELDERGVPWFSKLPYHEEEAVRAGKKSFIVTVGKGVARLVKVTDIFRPGAEKLEHFSETIFLLSRYKPSDYKSPADNRRSPFTLCLNGDESLKDTEVVWDKDKGDWVLKVAKSRIDPNKEITLQKRAITIIDTGTSGSNFLTLGGHAKIVIEGLEMREGKSCYFMYGAHIAKSDHADGRARVILEKDRDPEQLRVQERGETHVVDKAKVDVVLKIIQEEVDAQEGEEPKVYFYAGGEESSASNALAAVHSTNIVKGLPEVAMAAAVAFIKASPQAFTDTMNEANARSAEFVATTSPHLTRGNQHNCLSWARRKLGLLGIQVEKTSFEWIVARPNAAIRPQQ